MNEDQEKDQLGLWEKLGRLYGESAAPEAETASTEQTTPSLENEYAPTPLADMTPDSAAEEDAPESPAFPGSMFRLESSLPANNYSSSPASMNARGRVHETCVRCRRTCKQNGRKLNRMLCIGFLPAGE
jgi:hypothetical protein